ncbi:ABC transporter permease [Parabacteroides sp.]
MKIILLALRSLTRFRLYSTINIMGLALSLACVVTLSRYLYQETTVDHFHEHLDRLYFTTIQYRNSPMIRFSGSFNMNHEPDYREPLEDIAVERSTTFIPMQESDIYYENKKFTTNLFAADTNFLQMLDFPILIGNRNTLLLKPESAVITREFSKKLFGNENPIGKTLSFTFGQPVTIEGIIGNPTGKSSLHFDILISKSMQKKWSRMPQSIALLYPGSDLKQVNKRLDYYMYMKAGERYQRYQFFPMKNVYFNHTIHDFNLFHKGNKTNVRILTVVTFLILIIGLFNFTNIYTVLIQKRAREFGMKKVFGAKRVHLLGQIYIENIFIIACALFIGWVFVELTQDYLSNRWDISQSNDWHLNLMLAFILLILLPMFTSSYPFFKYQYATPIHTLQSINRGGNSVASRNIFLVIQYGISLSLIIVSLFFIKQLHFMLNYDNGYRTKDIIKVQFLRNDYALDDTNEQAKAKRKKQRQLDNIITTKMNESPLFTDWAYGKSPYEYREPHTQFEFQGKKQMVVYNNIDERYMKIYDLQMVEGRSWNDSIDHFGTYDLIINETAKKIFGITDIATAKLQPESRLWWSSDMPDMDKNPAYNIVGIVKDFQIGHLSQATLPLVFAYDIGYRYERLTAHIVPGKRQEAIRFLQKLHEETVGGEFIYSFVEDEIKAIYKEDQKLTNIYTVFALIAILISSLGLFGLSLFDVQQRYQEIAIRKVNGATTSIIMQMLLRKYYKLLAIAFIVATPITWLAIHKYLESFAHKASISWWLFAAALLLTGTISLLTLVWQIRKAARTNPAEAIKSE